MHIKLLNIGFIKKGDYYVNNEFEIRVQIIDDEHLLIITHDGVQTQATLKELEEVMVSEL